LSSVGQRADERVQQKISVDSRRDSPAESLIRQKLDEEIFGRIAKNLKWVRVLHGMALRSLGEGRFRRAKLKNKADQNEMTFLLDRIHTAEQCFSSMFTPVLNGLYPEKYESTELYGKYIIALYELAKYTRSIQMVTEELWEETLPEGSAENDYVASEKRVIQSLSLTDIDDPEILDDDFLTYVRNLHLAVTNLSSNFDQLRNRFQDNREVEQLCQFLKPRIGQIDNASMLLYKHAKGTTISSSEKQKEKEDDVRTNAGQLAVIPVERDSHRPSLSRQLHNSDVSESQLNHKRVLPDSVAPKAKKPKKWSWNGQVELGKIELKKAKTTTVS
jgi:hypothetical protein